MKDGITVVRNGPLLEITIDRPNANAIDLAASRALNDAVALLRDDKQLRIGIVTGAGERFFSPGWDLKAAAAGEDHVGFGETHVSAFGQRVGGGEDFESVARCGAQAIRAFHPRPLALDDLAGARRLQIRLRAVGRQIGNESDQQHRRDDDRSAVVAEEHRRCKSHFCLRGHCCDQPANGRLGSLVGRRRDEPPRRNGERLNFPRA